MRITYDPRYNIAYLRFQEKREHVETVRVSDELNVDMVPNGTIYGIELLNANEQLQRGDMGDHRDQRGYHSQAGSVRQRVAVQVVEEMIYTFLQSHVPMKHPWNSTH